MSEKLMKFEPSGWITKESTIEEIEFWGHDAGEFVEYLEELVLSQTTETAVQGSGDQKEEG